MDIENLSAPAPPRVAGKRATIMVDRKVHEELTRISKTTGWPIAAQVKRLAQNVDRMIINKLSEGERARYLAGELSADEYRKIVERKG